MPLDLTEARQLWYAALDAEYEAIRRSIDAWRDLDRAYRAEKGRPATEREELRIREKSEDLTLGIK